MRIVKTRLYLPNKYRTSFRLFSRRQQNAWNLSKLCTYKRNNAVWNDFRTHFQESQVSLFVSFSTGGPSLRLEKKPTINNGNRTEWSPIRSVIIRVINKIGRPRIGSPICLSRTWLLTELDDKKSCYQLIIIISISEKANTPRTNFSSGDNDFR